ncbi:MAG: DUF1553 domain-containing protein [Lentisphaeraceae bacterium]|nr:DUF1553 domain-containing protein [Lentisphaeraceae bacterium]
MKLLLCVLLLQISTFAEKIEFNQHIRPILSDKCFHCHGPDEKHIKGKLQLHKFDYATKNLSKKGKRFAIVPGDVSASSLWERVTTDDEDDIMPPPESHKKLTPKEKQLIKTWIEQGAEYQDHWSFIPINKPKKVSTKLNWGNSPIDNFVLGELEKAGLKPMPEADKATLIRRVTFDITGLPPTMKELDHFLADNSAGAYEKLIDRLLKSENYGEHMGRYWLDAARYGDTHGLHLDNYRSMWPYRDWVINAFNNNMPFSQFTIEQLAGDLLPNSTLQNKVASGFNRCNVTTSEGGSIAEEYYVRYGIDRTSTTSTVWLGLTTGCAACHDHKFDPVSTKEFYSLTGFFNNITEKAMDGNQANVPPIVRLFSNDDEAKINSLNKEVSVINKKMKDFNQDSQKYKDWLSKLASQPLEFSTPKNPYIFVDFENQESLEVAVSGKERFAAKLTSKTFDADKLLKKREKSQALWLDGKDFIDLGNKGDFERDQSFSFGGWIQSNILKSTTLISKLDNTNYHRGWDLYFENGRPTVHLIHSWPGDAIKVRTKKRIKSNELVHLLVTYDGSSSAHGIQIYFNGKREDLQIDKNNLKNSIRNSATLNIGRRYTESSFTGMIDDIAVYDRVLSPLEVINLHGKSPVNKLVKLADKRNKKQNSELHKIFINAFSEGYKELEQEANKLKREKKKIEDATPTTLVMQERETPRGAYVLKRGQYDQRGEKVEPSVPAFLPDFPKGEPKNRLGFAKWLLLPDHPLTSRVTVNRFWAQLFGRGIVETAEDFGSQGSWPTHPKLLDHLAYKFINDNWDIKALMKYMLMSAAYKQSSTATDLAIQKDPYNKLLSRGPRFRLDAEMLRDNALATAGLLVNKIGGKSVKPYQPDGIWYAVAYSNSNTRKFAKDSGDSLYRRTLYTFLKRTAPSPMMSAFDAPNRETCTVRRERTNTPLQALQMMNDVQFIEAARHLAANTLKAESQDNSRISSMFRKLTARHPKKREVEIMIEILNRHRTEYKKNPSDAAAIIKHGDSPVDTSINPAELAAWTVLANQLLNLDEVLNKG